MCAHNGLNFNCNICCYSSVGNTIPWYQVASCNTAYVPTTNSCFPVSPNGLPIPPALPADALNLQYANLVLTPTEFFAAPLAKYSIVAAPGSGSVIQPLQIRAFLKVVTSPLTPVAYDNGGTPILNFSIGGNTIATDSTILGGTADQTRFYNVATTLFTSTFDNLALEVGTNILPTSGNATLYIRVLYAITTL